MMHVQPFLQGIECSVCGSAACVMAHVKLCTFRVFHSTVTEKNTTLKKYTHRKLRVDVVAVGVIFSHSYISHASEYYTVSIAELCPNVSTNDNTINCIVLLYDPTGGLTGCASGTRN